MAKQLERRRRLYTVFVVALLAAGQAAAAEEKPETCRDYSQLEESQRRTYVGSHIWLHMLSVLEAPREPESINRAGTFIGLSSALVALTDLRCAADLDAPVGAAIIELLIKTEDQVQSILRGAQRSP